MSGTAPVSNGAVVVDEAAGDFVDVSFNFTSTGEYGTGSTFWVMQHITSSNPPPTETEAYPWVQVTPTPSDNSSSSFIFKQPRGERRVYYSRRFNEGGTAVVYGTPTPVSENVPLSPVLSTVTESTSGSNTIHTVNLSNLSTLTSNTYTTAVYYRQTTSTSIPAYTDSDNDGNPPTGWVTDNQFTFDTSSNTGTTFYYWALGWATTPGPDGAVISGYLKRTVGVTPGFGVFAQTPNGTYSIDSDSGISANNGPRALVVTTTGSTSSADESIPTSVWQNSDLLWGRPPSGNDGYVFAKYGEYVSGTSTIFSSPKIGNSAQYVIQRLTGDLNVATMTTTNGSQFGLNITNSQNVEIFDSRKIVKGMEIKQGSSKNTFPGGSFVPVNNVNYYYSPLGTTTSNLIYTAPSDDAFERTYVTLTGGFYTRTTVDNSLDDNVQIGAYYFEKSSRKIYFHSRVWFYLANIGRFLKIPIQNYVEILIGELLT